MEFLPVVLIILAVVAVLLRRRFCDWQDAQAEAMGDALMLDAGAQPIGKPWADSELVYAARARCVCGAGLAYAPKDPGTPPFRGPSAWDCSDILTGRAIESGWIGAKTHDGPAPFTFYEIKSEGQPSANGATTRPDGVTEVDR